MRKTGVVALFLAVFVMAVAPFSVFAAGEIWEAQKIFLRSSKKSRLFLVMPPGGGEKESLLMLELRGKPYERGRRHGELLADNIADVIDNRYCDAVFTPEVLSWVQDAYYKMPREWQDEIRGIADGLSRKGYRIPFSKVILHATQIPVYGAQFPWFLCPWEETANLRGSFSYAVWGNYTANGGTLAINSPDFGLVPKSLARNRVLFSIHPNSGLRHTFLGVAGILGWSGFNETGLSIAGTAGPISAGGIVTPEVGKPVPDGFMPILLIARHALQYLDAGRADVFEQYEELLQQNPIEGFHSQITLRGGRSVVWESGAARSPEYPRIARREAGEWDAGAITPVDYRGQFVLTQGGILRMDALPPVIVDFNNGNGSPYSGRAFVGGYWAEWRIWQLGRAFSAPLDQNRAGLFETWFANLGTALVPAPLAITGDGLEPETIVSSSPDGSGGFWITADGAYSGSWLRDGRIFRSFFSDGTQFCAGPLYDFGNGVAGWCRVGETDIEWVAWKFNFPGGADKRQDGMNLSVLPAVRPYAAVSGSAGAPHTRTHFVLQRLGEPRGVLTQEGFYDVFQRAYLAVAGTHQPFGVSVFDLDNLSGIFTASRYEEDEYIGGLSPFQKPIKLDRYQLFGW